MHSSTNIPAGRNPDYSNSYHGIPPVQNGKGNLPPINNSNKMYETGTTGTGDASRTRSKREAGSYKTATSMQGVSHNYESSKVTLNNLTSRSKV